MDNLPTRDAVRREVLQARQRAAKLVQALGEELRAQGGQSDGAESRPDLYKVVTGHSSLETALDEARRVVGSYDRLLDELDKGAEPVAVIQNHRWAKLGAAI